MSAAAEWTLIATALRLAADEIDGVISVGDVAECAAYVPGERGRMEAIEARDSAQEDPAAWLRARADAILVEADA
jgi:hypothetical protein